MLPAIFLLALRSNTYLFEIMSKALDTEYTDEGDAKEERARKKAEKKREKYEEEWKLKQENPQCTWLFEHFDMGNKYIYYYTLY